MCETCGGEMLGTGLTHAAACSAKALYAQCMQAFPFSAGGDVSGARLDAEEVIKARKIENGYAEKKPVWAKIPRHVARSKGGKITIGR